MNMVVTFSAYMSGCVTPGKLEITGPSKDEASIKTIIGYQYPKIEKLSDINIFEILEIR